MVIFPPLTLCAALHSHLFDSVFITFSLQSLSRSFLHLSLSFLFSSTFLHTLFIIFMDSKVPFTVAHMACQLYFIVLTVRTRDIRMKHSQNLNGLSIMFYCFHCPYTPHTKRSQTTTQYGACLGSPPIMHLCKYKFNI